MDADRAVVVITEHTGSAAVVGAGPERLAGARGRRAAVADRSGDHRHRIIFRPGEREGDIEIDHLRCRVLLSWWVVGTADV